MNCTRCGGPVIQGPGGGWSCGNCGASGYTDPMWSPCAACGWGECPARADGSYVCPQCYHNHQAPVRV